MASCSLHLQIVNGYGKHYIPFCLQNATHLRWKKTEITGRPPIYWIFRRFDITAAQPQPKTEKWEIGK